MQKRIKSILLQTGDSEVMWRRFSSSWRVHTLDGLGTLKWKLHCKKNLPCRRYQFLKIETNLLKREVLSCLRPNLRNLMMLLKIILVSLFSISKQSWRIVKIRDFDKLNYLLQVIVPNSNTVIVVEHFPATATNCQEVILQIQERFGREGV